MNQLPGSNATALIHVLVATHNRPGQTANALKALEESASFAGVNLRVFVSDSSTNRDTQKVLEGSGLEIHLRACAPDKYWADSMRLAWEDSCQFEYDYLLWLNDDVTVFKDSIARLLESVNNSQSNAIAIGSTQSEHSGEITYGAFLKGPWYRRMDMLRVIPGETQVYADYANGNLVLIPRSVDDLLRGFPRGFRQKMADYYYSAIASRKGIHLIVPSGVFGYCEINEAASPWRNRNKSRTERLKLVLGPKGLPPIQWARLCLAIGGLLAPAYFFRPYLEIIFAQGRKS